ncbi:MAG: hypothetical protein C0410_16065, partial [Anaerolinea sp.]|nr:hypothetical protein [Anaerolinea sp.]
MAISPGQLLQNKREEKKLSLEQAAQETNIRLQFLQAIEEDRMGAISSQAQLRGFMRLYASYLGINPLEIFEPVRPLEELPKSSEPVTDAAPDQSHKSLLDFASKLLTRKNANIHQPVQTSLVDIESSNKASTAIFKSIGADLQQQREDLGLSRYDVERQIKIRELYIFALENGLVDDLPSTVQGRGMLNNYAAFMNLDPEPLQMRFADGLQQRRV